ncbi:alpha-ketoglutarate-dependent dioxygenase AlkB [Mycobacterium stomatepiae]|uniref:Alkylated DNA repair protein n=1 Tax=Mycobacterium stomatepiae TaxID=470076 RepID=A0A7I7QES5_9MYCO|nr:alpha-ketoglutarate-dependent dioxygenase AlkB [Mycobacterium stomatepiae]MCV7167146.1 alpha-ketoglutarate-dependent dioxygenase AlkB [Mycobacterium stomatepiae]BBY24793.1 alkylated DNA repair protein [Mycobacterium stomatepiae]
MTRAYQATLFDDDETLTSAVDIAAFENATEHRLDEQSWITHVPGFLTGHMRLVDELATLDVWEQRQRWMYDRMVDEPRLTGEYADLTAAPALLAGLAATLGERLGVPYDRIWMNWYRDHHDGTGWHADRPANQVPTAIVPVLSLGPPRRFLLRPIGGGPSTVFTPAGGDLIIMQGRCQRDWQHCVPKQKTPAGARISLNFSSVTQS